MTTTPSTVRISGHLDGELSRGLWLIKWLLLVPHLIVLSLLWLAFTVLTVIAFFVILITERYPKPIFEFNLGVLRWTWRVTLPRGEDRGGSNRDLLSLMDQQLPWSAPIARSASDQGP